MKPTGEHREELIDELLMKERTITKLKEKLKLDTKLKRDKIGALEDRRDELLDLLEGREHVEPELPLVAPGKKAAPAPLKWERQGKNLVAQAASGTYCIEDVGNGFVLLFTPKGGKSKEIGFSATEPTSKTDAQKHLLEGGADAILENAGDGKRSSAAAPATKSG